MERFYFKLQGIISQRVFQDGEWEYLPAYSTDSSYRLFAWRWRFVDDRRLVVVNYSFVSFLFFVFIFYYI